MLEVKYLNSSRQLLLDHDIPLRACTKIWGLCRKAIPILASKISKVPKGGNSIRIGDDKIMGQQPINGRPRTHQILSYLDNKGIHNLGQISTRDIHTQLWTGWHFPEIPVELKSSLDNIQSQLHGIAPTKQNNDDCFRWDPSGTSYTVKAPYHQICNSDHPMPIWTQWKIAWKSKTLPKIKFFIWVLLKGKVLTSDNLKKRGILGPSRCPNYQAAEETIQHLFINCSFTTACWKEAFLKDQLP